MDQPGVCGAAARLLTCPGSQNETPLSSARETSGESASSAASTQTLSIGDQRLAPRSGTSCCTCSLPKSESHTYPAESSIDISKDAMQKRQNPPIVSRRYINTTIQRPNTTPRRPLCKGRLLPTVGNPSFSETLNMKLNANFRNRIAGSRPIPHPARLAFSVRDNVAHRMR